MKFAIAIATAALIAAGGPAFAGGYLPDVCAKLKHPPPDFFECPRPYVEMTRTGKDRIFSRAWHCRETEHSLGLNAYGGCAGSKGLSMFPGWNVPAAAASSIVVAQKADFHAEVLEWVIEPCMEVAAALDVKKYDEETIKAGVKRTHIAKIMVASREAATRQMSGKMKASSPWENRRAAYPIMLKFCIGQFTK